MDSSELNRKLHLKSGKPDEGKPTVHHPSFAIEAS